MKIRLITVILILTIVQNFSYSQQNVNGWFWLNGQPTGNKINWIQIVNGDSYVDGSDLAIVENNQGVLIANP